MRFLIVDALTLGKGRRSFTRDFIGAGPRMIAASLRSACKDILIIRGEDFLKAPDDFSRGASTCFVSAMSMDMRSVQAIASAWKSAKNTHGNNSLVFVGGPIALHYRDILKEGNVDVVIPGECEKILPYLATHGIVTDFPVDAPPPGTITVANVDVINYDDLVMLNRPSIREIQGLPTSLDLISSYHNFWASRIYIECTRGCSNFKRAKIDGKGEQTCKECGSCGALETGDTTGEFSCPSGTYPGCGFCSTPSTWGGTRSFDVRHITMQVEDCIRLGARRIVLGASDVLDFQREKLEKGANQYPYPVPAPNHEALEFLVDGILEHDAITSGKVQIFVENIKASLLDEPSTCILSRIPNLTLSIGVETGSDIHLSAIGKPATTAMIKEAARLLCKHQVRYHAYFIHSLPGQDASTVRSSKQLMQWLANHGMEKVTIYRFRPLPHTAFENGFPSKSRLKEAKSLTQLARRINLQKKHELVGKIVPVLVAERDFRDKDSAIGYMLYGGPKVKLPDSIKLLDDKRVHDARITGVLGDKIVIGELT
ncbi:hypothetical protein GF325_03135 [Candidatus Bathyarchaeota archaeon]|nr:hypothetical protein [Candidatus Bathyarchaeota archaeon]